jgi:predicted lipoprotein
MRQTLLLIFAFSFLFWSCDDSKKEEEENQLSFDQSAFLVNLSGNIIVPAYADFSQKVDDLSLQIDSLNSQSNQAHLGKAQEALKSAYLSWQGISHYEFGPAMNKGLKSNVNTFPADTTKIESFIDQGGYNLQSFSSYVAKGLPALDYLLNHAADSSILNELDQDRKDYLTAVMSDLKGRANDVYSTWNGSYKSSFNSSLGTDVGSSTGQLINALNQHYERFFRDGKIGIPIGVRTSGNERPEDSEAFYGGYSMELARANFKAMKKLYLGGGSSGLDDYLQSADADDLDQIIKTQFVVVESNLNSINDPLPQAIQSQSQLLLDTYKEIQKIIVYWKVDMPSRLGVLITYQDNDGD